MSVLGETVKLEGIFVDVKTYHLKSMTLMGLIYYCLNDDANDK
jgi:hypothetical protein